jgi:hypothetical protein
MTAQEIIREHRQGRSIKSLTDMVYARMKSDYTSVRKNNRYGEVAPTHRDAQKYVERVIWDDYMKK